MYAFAQRADTHVLDEPLYAYYLQRTGAPHPGRETVIAHNDTWADRVIANQYLGDYGTPLLFIKSMAHHLVGVDLYFLQDLTNILLIRNPQEMLSSLVQHLPQPGLLDTAYQMQYELFQYLQARGRRPLVIDAQSLCAAPEQTLRQICEHARITFDPNMLHWEPGAIRQEGIWGQHWYDRLHHSTGFLPYRHSDQPIPDHLQPLLDTCSEYYLSLLEHAWLPSTSHSSLAVA
ncbi:MAG: hypothetical protein OHK0039_31420 [Bacteroidia bacterium]